MQTMPSPPLKCLFLPPSTLYGVSAVAVEVKRSEQKKKLLLLAYSFPQLVLDGGRGGGGGECELLAGVQNSLLK